MSLFDWFTRARRKQQPSFDLGPEPATPLASEATLAAAALTAAQATAAGAIETAAAPAAPDPNNPDPVTDKADTDLLLSAFEEATTTTSPMQLLAASIEDVDPSLLLNEAVSLLGMAQIS